MLAFPAEFPRFACVLGSSIFLGLFDVEQEFTTEGEHVRSIGNGLFRSNVYGIAASGDIIVAGSQAQTDQVCMFDSVSGDLLRSFGNCAQGEGAFRSQLRTRVARSS